MKKLLCMIIIVSIAISVLTSYTVNAVDDVKSLQNSSYKLFDEPKTWDEAKEYCESIGGHLVTITSKEEQAFLIDTFFSNSNKYYWIGGLRNDNNLWEWVTGESTSYTCWNIGEPNNQGGVEDRININYSSSKGWNDATKNDKIGFICEFENANLDGKVITDNLYESEYIKFLRAIIIGGEKNKSFLEDKIVLLADEYGYITDLDSFALEDINKDGTPELYLKSKKNLDYGDLYALNKGKFECIGHSYNKSLIEKYRNNQTKEIFYSSTFAQGMYYFSRDKMNINFNNNVTLFSFSDNYFSVDNKLHYYTNGKEVVESQYTKVVERFNKENTKQEIIFYPLSEAGIIKSGLIENKQITVLLDNQKITFEQPPIVENGRTLVPMRAIFEAMGATVDWNNKTQTAIGRINDKVISLTLGSEKTLINSKPYYIDVPVKAINGRTVVPLRFIAESLGAYVEWNGNTSTINIYSNADANLISRVKAYTTDIPNTYNAIKNGSKVIETKEFKDYINAGINLTEVTAYNNLTNSDIFVGYQFEQYAKKSLFAQTTIGLGKLVFNGDIGSYITIQSPEKNRFKKMLISYMKDTADKKQVEYMSSEWMALTSSIISNINDTALKNNVESKVAYDTIIANLKYFNNPEKTIDGMAQRISIIVSQEAILSKNNVLINPMGELDSNAVKFLEDKYKVINKINNIVENASYALEVGTAGISAYQNVVEIYGLASTYDEYAYIFDLIEQKSDNAALKAAASELKIELNSKITTLCNETHKVLGSVIVATSGLVLDISLSSVSSKLLGGISSAVSTGVVIGTLASNIGFGTADMIDASTSTIGYTQVAELLKAELKNEKSTFKTAYSKSYYDASFSAKRFNIYYETLRQMRIAGEKSYLSMRSFDSALLKAALKDWTDYEKSDEFCNESINNLNNMKFK